MCQLVCIDQEIWWHLPNSGRMYVSEVGDQGGGPLSALGGELHPVQLGFSTCFSTKGGCEAAVHAAKRFLHKSEQRRVILNPLSHGVSPVLH